MYVQILQLVPVVMDVVDYVSQPSSHTSLAPLVPHFEYIFHHGLLVRDSLVPHVMVMICSVAFPSFLLHAYHSGTLPEVFLPDDSVVMPI